MAHEGYRVLPDRDVGNSDATEGVHSASPAEEAANVDVRFLSSLWELLKLLRPYAALLLPLLAVLEIVINAQVGKITGSYYRILLDEEWQAFWRLTGLSALLYAAATGVRSTTLWLSEMLAVRWRTVLTGSLQQQYLSKSGLHGLAARCDNPDQRMVQDASQFCQLAASMAAKLAATPFKLVYYSVWMLRVTFWPALLAVYGFFLVGVVIQRWVMQPVAALVNYQERLEGNLRFSHMRTRALSEQIAMWGGYAPEAASLQLRLSEAVGNQMRLVMWRWLLSAVTFALDYCGAILNFVCVALPIATGAIGEGGDSGETAQQISNASFATLSLIYSFTETLNLSDDLATLAGLTARVSSLRNALLTAESPKEDPGSKEEKGEGDAMLAAPQRIAIAPGRELEFSLHRLGPSMHSLALECFQEAPEHGCMLAVTTVQCCHPSQGEEAMDAALATFMAWQEGVRQACLQGGHWCDVSDPCTGFSVHGARRQRWNEVQAARRLLGYPVEGQDDVCPLLIHPEFGTASYLGTLFTTAPLPLLQSACHSSRCSPTAASSGRAQQASPSTSAPRICNSIPSAQESWDSCSGVATNSWALDPTPNAGNSLGRPEGAGMAERPPEEVAVVQGLSCMTGQGGVIVSDLSFTLRQGERLLLVGASGVGKSSLLRALRGLWPYSAEWVSLTDQVVFVPQRPIAAPGASLREQVVYPSSAPADPCHLGEVLQAVQLGHLLTRVQGSWEQPHDWQGELSPGELQRLAFARVLHQAPHLAIMDEPIAAVGAQQGKHLLGLLQEAGIAVLLTGQLGCPCAEDSDNVIVLNGE